MSIYYHVTLVIMLVKADVQLMPGQQWKYYEYFPQAINQNEERKKQNEEVLLHLLSDGQIWNGWDCLKFCSTTSSPAHLSSQQ